MNLLAQHAQRFVLLRSNRSRKVSSFKQAGQSPFTEVPAEMIGTAALMIGGHQDSGHKVIPTNEAELIFRFAQEIPGDWKLLSLQTHKFPDARLEIKGEIHRTEFEFESKSFLRHEHNVEECDLHICWVHDWEGCPLPVLCLQNPGWSEAKIPKLSEERIVGWQKSQAAAPLDKIQRAQKRVANAREAKRRAEAAVNIAQKRLARVERDITKANRSNKVKPLPLAEEEPEITGEPTKFVRGHFYTKANATEPWLVPCYDSDYCPPKRW